MATLLFEIGCEELPAWACREAEVQLPGLCERELGRRPDELLLGPRRLALLVRDLPERSPDEWVKGPPEHMREQAAEGFARKQGVAVADLEVREGFFGVTRPGGPVAEALPGRLDAIVQGLTFSKSMVWEAGGLRFARPVRWRLAKLDAADIAGDGASYGHRFTHGRVEVPEAETYAEKLRAAGVEPDQAARRSAIVGGLDAIGGWSDPAAVLEEVVFLVESPVVLAGSFDERFLQLPRRVVETAMQSHQRYFPLEGARFAFVANGGDPETVVAGNEQVLEGRLEDASFTFERDVAKGIEVLAEEAGRITFVAGAGTFADKTARLVALAEALGGGEASLEAARLAKADQAAELVREFPDLEGHIGAEYARLAGFPEAVCAAIDEQYLPEFAGGPLPSTEPGRVLAAAEKVDNLTVAFALGQRPSGSRDPYGLRRAAIGLCRLALEGGLRIDLHQLVDLDQRLLLGGGVELEQDPGPVFDFVVERFEGLLDIPVEYVRAARHAWISDLAGRARLAEWLAALGEEIEPLHTAYTRASKIVGDVALDTPARDDLLTEPAELELQDTVGRAWPEIKGSLDALDFDDAFRAASKIPPVVDRFFDEVMVMAEDESIRENRLRLLTDVKATLGHFGDLAQIPR
ncbi:MAG: glycine--tRNA ligase subunit beta [Gaiellales bacterium]